MIDCSSGQAAEVIAVALATPILQCIAVVAMRHQKTNMLGDGANIKPMRASDTRCCPWVHIQPKNTHTIRELCPSEALRVQTFPPILVELNKRVQRGSNLVWPQRPCPTMQGLGLLFIPVCPTIPLNPLNPPYDSATIGQ